MRGWVLPLCAALMMLAPPQVGAATVSQEGYGVGLLGPSVGVWYAYYVSHDGGVATLDLTWESGFPWTDYDMTLYREGALDDNALTQDEVVERSWHFGPQPYERISLELAPGVYVLSIEPIQSSGERFTLTASGGLSYAAHTVGLKL